MTFKQYTPTEEQIPGADEKTYCAVHTTVETGLRCNRCGRYMCTRCAVLTPVGYRCKECVNQQQDAFYKATQTDYLIAVGVALALSIPIGYVMARLFLLLILILSIPAGALIGEAVFRACGRRKGRYIPYIVAGCIVVGAIISAFPTLQATFQLLGEVSRVRQGGGQIATQVIISGLVPSILYAALSAFTAVGRLR